MLGSLTLSPFLGKLLRVMLESLGIELSAESIGAMESSPLFPREPASCFPVKRLPENMLKVVQKKDTKCERQTRLH